MIVHGAQSHERIAWAGILCIACRLHFRSSPMPPQLNPVLTDQRYRTEHLSQHVVHPASLATQSTCTCILFLAGTHGSWNALSQTQVACATVESYLAGSMAIHATKSTCMCLWTGQLIAPHSTTSDIWRCLPMARPKKVGQISTSKCGYETVVQS